MLVLFDPGTPKGLARALSVHTVHTAQSRGWDRLSNGELLNAAERAGFDLLTTDRRIRHQQNLSVSRIALVLLMGSTKWTLVQQHVDRIAAAVASATPGSPRGRDSVRGDVANLVRFTFAVGHATGQVVVNTRKINGEPDFRELEPCS
ncbi:MAG TPA: hypothetical protein VM791_02280 [Vicinamibacterales bacterium]|nr:hypothetical protein [Vicinamibacterales bacterium]